MKASWLIPAGLIAACIVPAFAMIYRPATILLENDWAMEFAPGRSDRLPLFVHALSAGLFYVLGALQVLPGFRRRHPVWHVRAGKVTILAGLAGALTGTWIAALHLEISGPVLLYGRLLFGPLWGLFLVLGVLAIVRRDFQAHRNWMIRAFAVAMPAGTLIVFLAPFLIVLGEVSQELKEAIQTFAWVAHLSIAQLVIHRRRGAARLAPA